MPVTPNITSVGDATASTTVLANNPSRIGATIVNASSAALFLRLDGGVADNLTGYSVQLAQGEAYTLPLFNVGHRDLCYQGTITGVWATDAGGSANVTEWVG